MSDCFFSPLLWRGVCTNFTISSWALDIRVRLDALVGRSNWQRSQRNHMWKAKGWHSLLIEPDQ